jgi:hypothetical protein
LFFSVGSLLIDRVLPGGLAAAPGHSLLLALTFVVAVGEALHAAFRLSSSAVRGAPPVVDSGGPSVIRYV